MSRFPQISQPLRLLKIIKIHYNINPALLVCTICQLPGNSGSTLNHQCRSLYLLIPYQYLLDDARTRSINLFNKWCRCQLGRRRLYSWHGCRSLIYFCPNCSYSLICVDIWRRNFRCIHLEHNRIVEKRWIQRLRFCLSPFPFGQAKAKDWLSVPCTEQPVRSDRQWPKTGCPTGKLPVSDRRTGYFRITALQERPVCCIKQTWCIELTTILIVGVMNIIRQFDQSTTQY